MRLFQIHSILIFLISNYSFAQQGFVLQNDVPKTTISFKLINNLVIFPLKINGTELNFLLDTGAAETVLFSLDDQNQININNSEHIKLKGFGSNILIDGLKSGNNIVSNQGFTDSNHTIYIILNQDFNISSQVGIPVNGIIGHRFFKNHKIEINYDKRKIFIYNEKKATERIVKKKFSKVPIWLVENKPFVKITIDNHIDANVLIDTGSGDALWLFENKSQNITIPLKNINDFLGHGLSGDIQGKRAKIESLKIDKYLFEKPIIAYPDSVFVSNLNRIEARNGSIGSEIIKRFNVIFDYPNQSVYFNKNKNFDLPFHINMSGIEVEHSGIEWVNEKIPLKSGEVGFNVNKEMVENFNYKFALKPVFIISNIRQNSPAALSGLLINDKIISINGQNIYNYSLPEINDLLKSKLNKTIIIEVDRNQKQLTYKFQLKEIL